MLFNMVKKMVLFFKSLGEIPTVAIQTQPVLSYGGFFCAIQLVSLFSNHTNLADLFHLTCLSSGLLCYRYPVSVCCAARSASRARFPVLQNHLAAYCIYHLGNKSQYHTVSKCCANLDIEGIALSTGCISL